MRTILIRFPEGQAERYSLIHRLRNYGESVYLHVREKGKGWGDVRLDEVDSATSEFLVYRVAKRKVRQLCRWLEEEAARQNLQIITDVQATE